MSNLNNLWSKNHLLIYPFLFLWVLPLLIGGFAQQSLMAHDEGLYATRARLMFDTGDWINPWQQPHYKTPGIYWLIAVFYSFFGIEETAVRLPSLLFGLVAIVLIYEIGRITINPTVGFLAACILNLQFLWLQYCRLGNPDIPTIVLVLTTILLLLLAEAKPTKAKNWLTGWAGFCLGLGLILRGFLIAIPLVALVPYLGLENRRHHHLSNPYLYLGLILGCTPTAIWLFLSWLRYGRGTFDALFGLMVTLGKENRDDQSVFFYFQSIFASSFPWGLIATSGLIIAWRNRIKYFSLLAGFPLVVFCLISIYSTRLHHYALLIYPFLALLAAFSLFCLLNPQQYKFHFLSQSLVTISYFFTALGLILLLVGIGVIFYFKMEQVYGKIAIATSLPWLSLTFIWQRKYAMSIWLLALLLGAWIGLFTAVNLGAIGNYEPDVKAFLKQPKIAQIINHNPNYILHGDDKTNVLLKFYLPNLQYNIDKSNLPACSYAFSDSEFLSTFSVPHKSLGRLRDWQLIQTTNCHQY
jgi:Dolichyl-phosphate-mannose-protein mannosyltransferase